MNFRIFNDNLYSRSNTDFQKQKMLENNTKFDLTKLLVFFREVPLKHEISRGMWNSNWLGEKVGYFAYVIVKCKAFV